MMRGLDDEMHAPKYAHVELERRWLGDSVSRPPVDNCPCTIIEDRYLDGTRLRLRRMSSPDFGETRWKLTKKYESSDAAARPIVTTYLPEAEFDLLRALPARELSKRRHHLLLHGASWSIDIFDGALEGLELIESEAEDRAALRAVTPPPWALMEITGLPAWQGAALAKAQSIPEV